MFRRACNLCEMKTSFTYLICTISKLFSDARIRAGEIVKGSRSGSGSPERALLSNEATPMHRVRTPSNPNNDNSSIFTENIDLSSPGFTTANRNIMIEPPRNIFDDI